MYSDKNLYYNCTAKCFTNVFEEGVTLSVRELSVTAKEELQAIPGLRFNDDLREKRLYDHDVGEMPGMAKAFLGNTTPAAVVQPETEEQVSQILKWAKRNQVPVVPRAAATSGYGGVVPVNGGIVLELVRMEKILSVDSKAQTVTVQPGVVWKNLDQYLDGQGLTLRLMPTSAPGSTVGGWLAQGGGGIGSYRYGWFIDNVLSARVVLPDGRVQVFTSDNLNLIYQSLGTTGIITEVTFKVKKAAPTSVVGAVFRNAAQVQQYIEDLNRRKLPLWHVGFINPTAAKLKGQIPPKTHHGHAHPRPQLPEAYIVLAAYNGADPATMKGVQDALRAAGGELLSQELTDHEWEDRFAPMKVKRLGPSLVPAEVVVPVNNLAAALKTLDARIKLPLVLECTVVSGSEVIFLGFIPHDIRKFSFNFAYSLSLSVMKIARQCGGRAYASGLYLTREAAQVYGPNLKALQDFKAKEDPQNLLNPGKLSGKAGMRFLIGFASAFEPIARAFGNRARPALKETWRETRKIPGDVVWNAYSCAQCGYCRNVCTLYEGKGWESSSPRGKWYFVRQVAEGKAKFDQEITDRFLMCTTCEKCDFVCQLDLPVEPNWAALRGELIYSGKYKFRSFPAFEMMAASIDTNKNIWANFAADRDKWVPEEIKPKIKDQSEVGYFAGCTASYVEDDIGKASMELLDAAGIEFTYLGTEEGCCGIPMLVAGKWDQFKDMMINNIDGMKKHGVKTVVTSCPACWLSWHTYYPEWCQKLGIDFDFEVKHYSEIVAEKLASGELKYTEPVNMKLTFHDSCHIGRAGGVYEPPREMLKALPGVELVEMEHNREDALCCGSVLTRISEPDPTSNLLGKHKIDEALAAGADAIVALCPCCQFQMRVSADANGQDLPVIDLAHIAAKGLGIELKDSTPYALEMWAVFDKMIAAMQLPAMADMMASMMPEMINAMPGAVKPMLTLVKYVPGMDALMKAMMPMMMPMMFPGMMPQVMPAMIAEMGRRVPMPDFMQRQMPDLMPRVMGSMMPPILPDLARLVAPAMIRYIKTGSAYETGRKMTA